MEKAAIPAAPIGLVALAGAEARFLLMFMVAACVIAAVGWVICEIGSSVSEDSHG